MQSVALLQLSFLPYGVLCALLSTTSVSLPSFMAGCCISRVKLAAYIWLAQSATTLQGLWTQERSYSWRDVVTLALSITCSLVSLTFVTLLANRQLRRIRQEQPHAHLLSDTQRRGEEEEEEEEEEGEEGEEGERRGRSGAAKPTGRSAEVGEVAMDISDAYDRLLSPAKASLRSADHPPAAAASDVCSSASMAGLLAGSPLYQQQSPGRKLSASLIRGGRASASRPIVPAIERR